MAFNYSPKIVTDGLVLYMDAANSKSYVSGSTTWNDISRGGNNGTLVNGPTFNTGSGGNIVFDGVNDYVSTLYFGNDTGNYTFSVWYNPLSFVNTNPLNRGRDGSGNGWSLLLGSDNSSGNRYRAGVVKTDGGTVGYMTYSTNPMILNQWVQLTGIWISGNSINLYVNGVFNSSVSVLGTVLRTSTDGWILGSITTTLYSKQQIAQTSIYNRALSQQEVLQNYNATKTRFGLT
jgi:hypothetical protein